jgi:hypothetical protein
MSISCCSCSSSRSWQACLQGWKPPNWTRPTCVDSNV